MKICLWILSLAFLAVGARNFEEGLSVDGPLYAAIARALSRASDIFVMSPGLSDYPVYFDHPHFGFWLHAIWLKFFPATDWSVRIPSHLMYVFFLWGFWKVVQKLNSARVATVAVLLLWIWSPFSNFFSNFYLDPGVLLFGSMFLVFLYRSLAKKKYLSIAAGLFLGIAAGYKGLTVLAFGPIAAMLCMSSFVKHKKNTLWVLLGVCAGASIVLVPYLWGLSQSQIPNFLHLYWQKQISNRFAGAWGILGVFQWNFWKHFFLDTLGVGLLMLVGLWKIKNRSEAFLIPFVLFLTVVLMYAPADRSGAQYGVLYLPWAAWLSAQVIEEILKKYNAAFYIDAKMLMKLSAMISVSLVCLLQYFPFSTHSRRAPGEVQSIQTLENYASITGILFDLSIQNPEFVSASPLLWYLDRPIEYVKMNSPLPSASEHKDQIYVLRHASAARLIEAKAKGWCAVSPTVYTHCLVSP
jgi:4-amino-4-deoxy-L-arabinose transferase-like glycosyltransferase